MVDPLNHPLAIPLFLIGAQGVVFPVAGVQTSGYWLHGTRIVCSHGYALPSATLAKAVLVVSSEAIGRGTPFAPLNWAWSEA